MWCKVKDLDIHYKVYGEGRPLVIIHGYGIDHQSMTGCMEPLFTDRKGWRRIYPDLPGMGLTKGKSWLYNSDQMLEVINTFIDTVIPGECFTLCGYSYGGYLARGVVHNKRAMIDGIFLLCPVIDANHSNRNLPQHTCLVKDEAFFDDKNGNICYIEFESYAVVQNQYTWERNLAEMQAGVNLADQDFLDHLAKKGYSYSFDVDDLPLPFEKPALLLTGRQDSIVGYRDAWKITKNYPRCTYAVLDCAGHILQIEQSKLFNAMVHEWLDRVEEGI